MLREISQREQIPYDFTYKLYLKKQNRGFRGGGIEQKGSWA